MKVGVKMRLLKVRGHLAYEASKICALSWKKAYQGIIPQNYLDDLPLNKSEASLINTVFENYHENFLLEDQGKYVAMSSIGASRDLKYKDFGEIMSIYVLPEMFRKGYGRYLFEQDLKKLKEQGYFKVYLWVLEQNKEARLFYEKMGFYPNGDAMVTTIGGKEVVEIRYVNSI